MECGIYLQIALFSRGTVGPALRAFSVGQRIVNPMVTMFIAVIYQCVMWYIVFPCRLCVGTE